MGWLAAAPWIASGAGSLLGGLLGKKGQKDANEVNLQSAREAMAFEERMSSSAHQREVQDLLKAGLNPMLSLGGRGASTPQGQMATVANEESALGAGVTSAGEAVRARRMDTAAINKLEAEALAANQSASESRTRQDLYRSQEVNQKLQADQFQQLIPHVVSSAQSWAGIDKLQEGITRSSAAAAENMEKMYESTFGEYLPYINVLRDILGSGVNSAKGIRDMIRPSRR